jgi:hypothetical protein
MPRTEAGAADSLSMPHEVALARACGLPAADGLVPLAAWQEQQAGRQPGTAGWAWITPCHWRVGRDQVLMAAPQELQLDGDDSRALLQAMQAYFAEDGIELHYDAPLRWLARSELFATLPTAALDRVIGRAIAPWMPRGDAGRTLRRLQQEMQMLLYTLPLNEERERGGLLPVNSFWASGSGALPPASATQSPAGLRLSPYLRDAALAGDWAAWQAAWQQLDARECARLLAELEQGHAVRVTLCGEASCRSWSSGEASGWRRFGALFKQAAPVQLLEGL